MGLPTEIFFSYAWGDEAEQGDSREKLVNELYGSLLADGYGVVRDKYDLGYKGFIGDFMKRIGEGKAIIVAVSEKYVRSPYCMFELYEIARNCKFDKYLFREKVLPLVIEFVDFTKPEVIDEYLGYWEKENEKWTELIKKRAGQLSKEKMERYDKIRMVYHNFDMLTDWLADMNTLTLEILSANNFSKIKEELNRTAAKPANANKEQNELGNSKKESDMTGGPKYSINNEGAKIGQQNLDSDVNNSGTTFNIS